MTRLWQEMSRQREQQGAKAVMQGNNVAMRSLRTERRAAEGQ